MIVEGCFKVSWLNLENGRGKEKREKGVKEASGVGQKGQVLNRLEKAKGGEKGGRRPLSTCVSLCNKVSVHHSKFDPCIPGKVGDYVCQGSSLGFIHSFSYSVNCQCQFVS